MILRLGLDWGSFYWTPADVFGSGKVLVFGEVIDKNGTPYSGDVRGLLKTLAQEQYKTNGYTLNAANEIEGFLFDGLDAERGFPRNRQVRVHELGRVLPLAAGRSTAGVHRFERRGAARDGL